MSQPNPWLPDATGRATANDYDFRSQNGQGNPNGSTGSGSGGKAQDVARALAMTGARYAAARYGPRLFSGIAAAVRGLVR